MNTHVNNTKNICFGHREVMSENIIHHLGKKKEKDMFSRVLKVSFLFP